MLRDAVITLLNYRLGNRTDLTERMILEMDYVQAFTLEGTGSFIPWFLASEMTTTTVGGGEERIQLPSDFLGEMEDQALWLYDADSITPYKKLIKRDYDLLVEKYIDSGIPAQYAISGDYFLIKPTPNDTYTIKMRYYASDISVTTGNIENKWLKHAADMLMAETGVRMAMHIRNSSLRAEFAEEAERARQRVYVKHESLRHTNRIYGMGED